METSKQVDIGTLPTFKPLNGKIAFASTIELVEVLKATGRDRTVQRESVWRNILNKQSEYMSAVAYGYSQTSLFHLVLVEETITFLKKKGHNLTSRDGQYIEHLTSFLDDKKNRLHVDGGNRSDTIVDWYDNKVPLMPGLYPLPTGKMVPLAKSNYYTRKQLINDGGDFAVLSEHIDSQTFTYYEYGELDEEDRKRLFVNLNANENLTPEEFRNCETAPICGLIRDLNDKYKEVFVKYGFVTKGNAERYKFCAWLASLLNYYTFNNSCDSWTPVNLDKDYKGTTGSQDNFPEWKVFFEDVFYPLVELIANYKTDSKGNPKGFKNLGPHRNLLIDLYVVLVTLKKNKFELSKENRKFKLKEFFETYKHWVSGHLADTKAQYNANGKSLSTFADLYGANTNPKFKHRLLLLNNEFIPLLKSSGLVIEKDVIRNAPDKWRMLLWQKQNGVCPLTNNIITQDEADDGDVTHMDHIIPHSKGGKTTLSNMQLVFAEANLSKSDK